MGIGPGSRCKSSPYAVSDSNPNPKVWKLIREKCVTSTSGQQVLIVEVNYPHCTNFEGNKIMVYIGFSRLDQLVGPLGGELDPHFQETRFAPVARFRADNRGWILAQDFAATIR